MLSPSDVTCMNCNALAALSSLMLEHDKQASKGKRLPDHAVCSMPLFVILVLTGVAMHPRPNTGQLGQTVTQL